MDAAVRSVVERLRAEAQRTNQRRGLVLTGSQEETYDALQEVTAAPGIDPGQTTLVGERDLPDLHCERLPHARAGELLGTTREVVVLDAHDRLDPNSLGRVVGAVDGGGLLVVLAPPIDGWADCTDGFDETLAVPPHDADEVTGHFRRRMVETIRSHPGIAIMDIDAGTIARDGLTDPPGGSGGAKSRPESVERPGEAATFPDPVYDACLTADQANAVAALEVLAADPDPADGGEASDDAGSAVARRRAVVLEADRGRGKSSAAGIAVGALAADGADVLVTAPEFRSAREVFARAREVLTALERETSGDDRRVVVDPDGENPDPAGRVRYLPPVEAAERAGEADVLIVDEAAALPVRTLAATLSADRVVYATTVRGYEGAGRGFAVRFRDHLAGSDHDVDEFRLDDPIRYARDDPVESWAFRALLLDARPPVEQLVADATPETVEYRALDPDELVADEHLLREVFGLLVLAHYRTEPDDLARLLDAPNVSVRALLYEGHVVSVALLAREGGLPEDVRAETYEGARIRGHMIPDVLVSQLRDERAGIPVGQRVMRIATHHAVRSQGLGSALLDRIRAEFEDEVDWLGTGFGATPELLDFWHENDYHAVHLSVTRNDRSGERSAIVLSPTSDAGQDLFERHARWFADRVPAMLSDPLRDADPDVVRASLRTVDATVDPDLTDREWRVLAGAAYGPGLFKANPGPFRRLVASHLIDPADGTALAPEEERLLVATALQGRPVEAVAEDLDYHSTGQCLRAVGDALATLVDLYGGELARKERDRFE